MLGEGTLKQLFLALALAVVFYAPNAFSQSGDLPQPNASQPGSGSAVEPIDETTLLFDIPAGEPGADGFATAPAFGVGDFVRMVLVLGLVVASIYGVFFVLKKASGGSPTDSDIIRPLGTHTLPGNKSLHLVEIGNQVFLIGAADHAVSLIAEISDKETIDRLVLEGTALREDRKKSFSQLLSGVLSGGRTGTNTLPSGNGAHPFQFMHQQKERLKRLRSG